MGGCWGLVCFVHFLLLVVVPDMLSGPAACMRKLPETERDQRLLAWRGGIMLGGFTGPFPTDEAMEGAKAKRVLGCSTS